MPGGTAVVTAVLCAFFTVLTGGSGVGILALGGILMPALLADGYRERFSLGLLTAARSLLVGGFLPGLLMLGAGRTSGSRRVEDPARWGVTIGVDLSRLSTEIERGRIVPFAFANHHGGDGENDREY